jgi:hypothetical protein
MGYQSRTGSSRASGRGGARSPHEKAKTRGRKHPPTIKSVLEESHVSSSQEIADRTLTRLRNLGGQKFASSPFREHFNYWLVNLEGVLSEFESDPAILVDDQFVRERSKILSEVKLALDERRREEIALEGTIKSLSENKFLLERIEDEYATHVKEIQSRMNIETKRLSQAIEDIRGELDEIAQLKTGFFKRTSKKVKVQKEIEANQRLKNAKKDLELAVKNFTAEQENLNLEHDGRKQSVIEQMRTQQKMVENQETDASQENRQKACNALIEAVDALIRRKSS